MIRVGLIGYGYWGTNLARNFAEAAGCDLAAVSDLGSERLSLAARRFPGAVTTRDYRDLLRDPGIDAVAIATPVSTHFELGMEALGAGKHLLVEKPLAATSEQARRLIDRAEASRLTLMVDHTFVFTGAVRKIRDMVSGDAIGDVHYYDSVRVNLGLFQHDVDVIWDLAIHDLSIMDCVLPARPRAVSATGISHVPNGIANIAYLTMFFDGSSIAHVHVSWVSPVKIRRTLIGGSRKMILYDDLEPSEKIKVYDKGFTVSNDPENIYRMLIGYRAGDMYSPQVDPGEALAGMVSHFIDCIEAGAAPITGGEAGLWMVRTLEASTFSLKNQGRPVDLENGKLAS